MMKQKAKIYIVSSLCLFMFFVLWFEFSTSEWHTIRTIGKEMGIAGLSYKDIKYKYEPYDFGPHGEVDDYWILEVKDDRNDKLIASLESNPYTETITMNNRAHHQLAEFLESFQSADIEKEGDMLSIKRGYILGYNITTKENLRFDEMIRMIYGEFEEPTFQIEDWRIMIYDVESKHLYIWVKNM